MAQVRWVTVHVLGGALCPAAARLPRWEDHTAVVNSGRNAVKPTIATTTPATSSAAGSGNIIASSPILINTIRAPPKADSQRFARFTGPAPPPNTTGSR